MSYFKRTLLYMLPWIAISMVISAMFLGDVYFHDKIADIIQDVREILRGLKGAS